MIEEKDFPGYFLIVHDIVDVRARAGHPLPGPGLGGQLGGLLRARHHRGRPDPLQAALRAVPLRARATRSRTSTSTSTPTGARRSSSRSTTRYGRHNAAQVANVISYRPQIGGSRHGEGARLLHRAAGRLVASRSTHAVGDRSRQCDDRRPRRPRSPVGRALAEQLLKAPRHLGIHSGGMVLTERPVGEVCPIERGRMDEPHRAAVGQGRLRVDGAGEVRPARASACSAPSSTRFDLVASTTGGALGRSSTHAQGGAGGLRHALPGRLDRGLPGREPGPDRHPAPAAAARFYDLVDRDRADPPRPDPGRRRAPLHPPARPAGRR